MGYELSQSALPQVLESISSLNTTKIKLLIPQDSPSCLGHFPGYPIIPGYILLAWTMHFLNNAWPVESSKLACRQVKFLNPAVPGTEVDLEILNKFSNKFSFQFHVAKHCLCSGEIGLSYE